MPQYDYRDLGKVGYHAYGDVADWKGWNGKPMPQWDDLPEDIRVKWTAAAKAIVHGIPSDVIDPEA